MSGNVAKQVVALVTVGSFLTRVGIQPGGVLFGGVLGFTAGSIAARDYGLNYEDVTKALGSANSPAAAAATSQSTPTA